MSSKKRPRSGFIPSTEGADRAAFGRSKAQQAGVYVDRNGQPITVQKCAGMERYAGQDARLYVDPASVPVVDARIWAGRS